MATIIYQKSNYKIIELFPDNTNFNGLNKNYFILEIKYYGKFNEKGEFIGQKPKYLSDIKNNNKEKLNGIRKIRNNLLDKNDWLVMRHRDEIKLLKADKIQSKTLTEKQFIDLLQYKQELRELPQKINLDQPKYPKKPFFI